MDEERTLWCGNISEKVTDEILYELFLQGGPLEKVHIPKDKSGRQRKFAFIVYKHACSVPYAAALFEGTALFRKVLLLQHRQSVGGDVSNSSNTPGLQRSLPCPANTNPLPNSPTMSLGSQIPIVGSLINANQLVSFNRSLMNPIAQERDIGSLAKSSLMGTWNRNHPYTNSLNGERERDRYRSTGYNRMEPTYYKKYGREDPDSHTNSITIVPNSHKKFDRMEPDMHRKSGHHSRRYQHRRDYR